MNHSIHCWKCQAPVEGLPLSVPFRATCERCGSYLHVCRNCQYYSPGRSNDCSIPDIELVSDKEHFNYCEEFSPAGRPIEEKGRDRLEVERKLFGDREEKRGGGSFDDLFKG